MDLGGPRYLGLTAIQDIVAGDGTVRGGARRSQPGIDLNPEYAFVIGTRGQTYRLLGRFEEALADLSHAIDLDSEYDWAFAQHGENYRRMGRHEEALADLRCAIELKPSDRGLHA